MEFLVSFLTRFVEYFLQVTVACELLVDPKDKVVLEQKCGI